MEESEEMAKNHNDEESAGLIQMVDKVTDGTNSDAGEGKAANIDNETSRTRSREEGELFSSDDDDLNTTGSASQFAGCDTALGESVQASPVNEPIQDSKAEQCGPDIKSASVVGVSTRASQHSDNVRSSEKNRGPFVPFVISFSDDETGSDSDDSRRANLLTKVNKECIDRSRRPPLPSLQRSQKLQQNMTKKARLIRREVPQNRPYVSSMAKVNGSTSWNSGQKSGFRNVSNLQNRAVQNHIPGQKTTLHLNANKQELQDLRQLIAVRESEIKLKAALQTKNSVGGSGGSGKFRNPNNYVDRVRKPSVFDLRNELGEPDKKRLKNGELLSRELGSYWDKNLHCLQPIWTSGKSRLVNCSKESVADHSQCNNTFPSLPSNDKVRQVETWGSLSSANPRVAKEGNNIVANISQSARNSKTVDSVSLLKQTRQTEKRAIGDFPKTSNNVELDHTEYTSQDVQMAIHKRVASSTNLSEMRDKDPVKSSDIDSKLRPSDRVLASSLHGLNTNQQEAPVSNERFLNDLNKMNMMPNNEMDLWSLLDFEELQDNEIEEAREQRRVCEFEERNALMAYRKAQRALIEANARCSHLYSKRELYSAQLRSLMMENPNLFFSQRHHDQKEAGFNSSDNVSDVNMHLIPSSSHQVLTGSDVNNKCVCDTGMPTANNELQNLSNLHVSEQTLVSDPCCEPEGSPSKGHKQPVANVVCSLSGDLSQSSYEDGEIFELNRKSGQDNGESGRISEFDEGREKDIYEESERRGLFDSSQDCLLLEASLRSQLFEKLKAKRFSKRGTSMEHLVERRAENNHTGKMIEINAESAALCEAANDKHLDSEEDRQEERFPELPVQINYLIDNSHSEHESPPTEFPMNSCVSLEGQQTSTSGTFFFPAMKSAFGHLKVIELLGALPSKTTSSDVLISSNEENEHGDVLCKRMPDISSLNATETSSVDLFVGQSGSISCSLAIDPVWPLCMYELRGKCNNNECSRQHLKGCSFASIKHNASDNSDVQFRKQSQKEQFSYTVPVKNSPDHLVLAPPTYVVAVDILRPDSQSRVSASTQGYGQCWQKSFSAFLVLSSLCPTVSHSNEPFLHGTEARIEVLGSWDRRSSYFHSRNGTLSQLDHCASDVDQSVEMALLDFNKDADKCKSGIEALEVLARAIEDYPTSTVLWIVYLQIFYNNPKAIERDDLFQYAVDFNKESYELWLLYINSRVKLEDRLAAYDTALLALSHHTSVCDDDGLHASQCILDIFLQMIDCLCMSGNLGMAIEKISGLFSSTKKSEDHLQLSLSDTVTCLSICEKFIFWICCVYLVVYKKLPDPVVQQFECRKESFAIEWPSAYLTFDEKHQAAALLEMAVDSLESYMNRESLENEKTLRAAHMFALNHVRCVAVLEGLECSRNLLEKYIKLYPSCLELVLMSARAEYELGGLSFRGFEEALRNWPDEVGFHCIWNQYAVCALQSGKLDFVKELMDRWLHSVLEARDSEIGVLRPKEDDSDKSLQSISVSDLHDWFCSCGQNDTVFVMLNMSLYKLLQNNWGEARIALELALKSATADNYLHCLRELVPFWLTDSVQHKGEIHLEGILNILNVHLVDIQACVASEPLSRAFIKKIKQPRVQQLVSKLLSPVSADFSLMLAVLEVWHGLTLLPNVRGKQKDMVDFVEAMMEILPCNYLLAVSVCKELCISANSTNISASLSFWASSLLVNALLHAIPVAPEYAWVEAAEVLHKLTDIQSIKKSLHEKAALVYPFSIKLWKSYLNSSESEGNIELVKEAAKAKGIEL